MKTTANLTSQGSVDQVKANGKVTTNPLQPQAAGGEEGLLQMAGAEEELLQKKENPLQLKYTGDNPLKPVTYTGNPLQQIPAKPIQKKANKTGLPDQLKSGVENLSGYALDDVKVHYNSDKPSQLQAHAYAQGTDIHVAPGQEKHLPHEAWHVVQQKQGRVQPTIQMKAGVAINDDKGLENEADVMGAKALLSAHDTPDMQSEHRAVTTGESAPVQRAIVRGTWDTLIAPNLTTKVIAKLTGGPATVVKRNRENDFVKLVGTKWVAIDDDEINDFLAAHTWDNKLIHGTVADDPAKEPNQNEIDMSTPDALASNIAPGPGAVPMNVEELAGDRHSFLHHSYSTYSAPGATARDARVRREGGHHLTVENAHLLAMLALQGDNTLGHTDKTAMDKPGVNAQLGARGVTGVDNLNFFPRASAQTPKALGLGAGALPTARLPERAADVGAEAVDEQLSLQEYLNFIQKSLSTLEDVPPVYGAKILHTAKVMQTRTGLDPAALFLKVGKGDQRQLVRVVLTMAHNNLAEGLELTPEILAVFKRYVTNKSALPFATPITPATEWVAEGALAKDGATNYNTLETRYVDTHYAAIITAMKAFVAAE